ncbi:Hpt domain-containing protein [Aliikangiella maris]|uniref:HD domain-containing phosphohydrolase n=2 Tax=Aliikangiella maris TaxID=3162458 RepID=A0ABV2BT71_9GAMM
MSQADFDAFNQLEDEVKQEFYEDVLAAIKDIGECATTLESGADAQVIDRMFRSLHTVKGNCNMVFLTTFVETSHKLEDLFSNIRSGKIDYHDVYGQFAIAVVDLIKKQLINLINTQTVEIQILSNIENLITKINQAEEIERLVVTEKAIIAIQDGHFNLDMIAVDHEHGRAFSFLEATDFEFFQFIADLQVDVDEQQHLFLTICESLVLKLNTQLNRSVDEQQLKAAVLFIALSRRLNSTYECKVEQVFFASGLLARMAGWNIAAEVILQMLERHDGKGAPKGLQGEAIMPAAQALGLAVEFALTIIQNQSKGYKLALFAAVKSINGQKELRYKARLIERFNNIIKNEYLTSHMW